MSDVMLPDHGPEKGDTGQLRGAMRAARRAFSKPEQMSHARAVAQHCLQIEALTGAQTVGAYLPMAGELDPSPTTALLAAATFVPVVGADFTMEFRLFAEAGGLDAAGEQPLVKNRYGILEPPAGAPSIAASELDAVLVPLVAFDSVGNRVGMGGGYYDRAFDFRKGAPGQRPVLVGVAHSVQGVAELTSNDWDVPLDYVVTEHQVHGPHRGWMAH